MVGQPGRSELLVAEAGVGDGGPVGQGHPVGPVRLVGEVLECAPHGLADFFLRIDVDAELDPRRPRRWDEGGGPGQPAGEGFRQLPRVNVRVGLTGQAEDDVQPVA